ncbi:hypothetical protein WA026_010656 [Henosepilachna vigintioctopunctata]|uniref:Uncharacterized protein n=1 Tax=Henosepilachna vigintioctopunctata TaxID=420089 RepID=A0AAW1URI6_9CUCU
MIFLSRALILSVLIYVGDFKNVDINAESKTDREVLNENVVEEMKTKRMEEKIELAELKKNIGKVGNKLEGIVYEVLKEFLGKSVESSESDNLQSIKKNNENKLLDSEGLLKKYPLHLESEDISNSVADNSFVHSEKKKLTPKINDSRAYSTSLNTSSTVKEKTVNLTAEIDLNGVNNMATTTESIALLKNTSTDSNEEKITITSDDHEQRIGYTSTELNDLEITSESETPTPKKETSAREILMRRRRMIRENTEQMRSVENFVEPNSEHEVLRKSRRKFEDRARDSSMMGIPQAQEEDVRISHRRTQPKPQIVNELGRENQMYNPNENHKTRKFSPENEHIEEISGKPKRKRLISTNNQIQDNSDIHEAKKISSESKNKKMMSTSNSTPDGLDDTRLGQSFGWGNQPTSPCFGKNEREEILEKQHIEDLKYEVGKLRSVVDLLREQQRLLNSFDYGPKKDLKEQEMLKMFNNKDTSIGLNDKSQPNALNLMNRAKHEELEQIKIQINQAVDNLNKTKELLNMEHEKELNIEEELRSQKTEINWLKLIVENFVIAQTKRDKANQNLKSLEYQPFKENTTENPIVGVPVPPLLKHSSINRTAIQTTTSNPTVGVGVPPLLKHTSIDKSLLQTSPTVGAALPHPHQKLPLNRTKTVPSTVRMAEEKIEELEREKSQTLLESETDNRSRSSRSRARANEFATVGKLLDLVNEKQSKSEKIEDEETRERILEVINEVKRKKEKELTFNDLVRKIHEEVKNQIGKEELEQMLKMQTGGKNVNAPSGKSDDFDIEDQLRVLQSEINKLKSNDDSSFSTENKIPLNNPEEIQAVLARLITGNLPIQNTKSPSMDIKQLMQLQNVMKIGNGMATTGTGTIGGDIGMGSSANINPFAAALSKLGPFYAPYAGYLGPFGPYQALYGYPGGNGYWSGHYGAQLPSIATKSAYGSNYVPSSVPTGYKPHYAKIQDAVNSYNGQPSYPNPFTTKLDQYDSEKQIYGGNNFFQTPNFNSGSPPASNFPPKIFDTEGFDKINTNQFQNTGASLPIAVEKINELKNQIHEDRNTIHSLEQQIEELRRIVSSLNGYSADQLGYIPSVGNYESVGYVSPDYSGSSAFNNRGNEKRNRRSIIKVLRENPVTRNHDRQKRGKKSGNEESSDTLNNIENKTRKRRSADINEENQNTSMLEQLTSALSDALEEQSEEPSTVPLLRRPLNQRKGSLNEISHSDVEPVKHPDLQNIKQQIDNLKKELGHHNRDDNLPERNKNLPSPTYNTMNTPSSRHALLPEPAFNPYNYNAYATNLLPPLKTELSVKPKKVDIFKSIISKIMDKVVESLPVIVHKLFGFAVHELSSFGDFGAYNGGYGLDGGVFKSFKSLGLFGFLPLILIRLVNGISTFIYVLQKNKFLKYFLVPAGIVLLVGSSVVFLIWWLQPGDYYLNYEKSYNKYPYDKDYSAGYEYQNDYGKSSGQIVKSYGGNEDKPLLHSYKSIPEVKSLPYVPNEIIYPPFYKTPQIPMTPDYVMPSYAK